MLVQSFDETAAASNNSSCKHRFSWGADDNGEVAAPDEDPLMKVNIIDCSDIEQNVHNLRHSYYILNTQMVADICEVIGELRPARQRSRLVCIPRSGIYTFACPPGGYHPD